MISNQEDDEFVAVRVQDPRIQNEGSWNSYVDYKIFLHTNSKAFTAKTSCVRRRYSEFAWLKKKLQKNAGLVPVPDLPAKSFFSFSNEDFLEGRRKGLQTFLDKVVHMTVCLSDSQLHLFLQTPAAGRTHRGLRAGPHAVHRDGRHTHLRLVQSGLRSGAGGRLHQGAESDCFVRVHGEPSAASALPTN
ncbi:Sorting nexin-11 [Larimichthys crocea]|uniref:Sorting nexin-11 n=1 Tax=Larimichthys crocea TaxID=215358 RepID=A0A6G0HXI9_LARCR|nr:Sorting nexin-11 [Larimichthys crocea]